MKKQIHLLAIFVLLLVSCSGDQTQTPAPPGPATNAAPFLPSATLPPPPSPTQPPTQPPVQSPTPLPSAVPSAVSTSQGVIVFYSDRDGNSEIYRMNPDGSNLQWLTNDPAYDESPAISPDGSQIVFLTSRHDPNPQFPFFKHEIYLMNLDGSDQRRLTTSEAAEDHPAWSPDGEYIVFDADYDGDDKFEIYTLNVDSNEITRLTANDANDQFADWSPDGKQIAFTSDRNGNYDLFLMDADGNNQRPLTETPGWELFPAWSPDGKQIAYFACDARCRPKRQDIFVMNADGSNIRQLTHTPAVVDEDPAWSPDGEQIVFQSDRDGSFEIYVMNSDGSDQQRLTKGAGDNYWPSWGMPAATGAESEELPELQPIALENANQAQLLRTLEIPGYTQGPISQCSLAFSPNGALLAGACGKNQVPVWDVASGQVRHLLYDKIQQIVACDFSPDGAILACGGMDKTITFWNPATGEKIREFGAHQSSVWEIDFSPDGRQLVSCSLAEDIRLWDVQSAGMIWSYQGTKKGYLSVAFDPAGQRIAFGGRFGRNAGVLDFSTGALIIEMNEPGNAVGDVTFSPSGKLLAAGADSNLIYLWDAQSYQLLATLAGHSYYVNGISFSPDESLLVSGSHDLSLGIWDIAGQRLLNTLTGHENTVLRVTFSPDGKLIASISWDGTVRLWGVP